MSATRILFALLFALGVLAPKPAVAQRFSYGGNDGDYSYHLGPRTTYRVGHNTRVGHDIGHADIHIPYGPADLIRATSDAWIKEQEAYAKSIENRQKAARTYWEMRKEYREHDREERCAYFNSIKDRAKRELEYEKFRRDVLPELRHVRRAHLERLAKFGAPRRLSPSELDTVTGRINWPQALKEEREFSRYRLQIESFFKQRSQPNFRPSFAADQDVLMALGQMRAKLKSQVRDLDPGEYIVARKFLDSLTQEVRRRE